MNIIVSGICISLLLLVEFFVLMISMDDWGFFESLLVRMYLVVFVLTMKFKEKFK